MNFSHDIDQELANAKINVTPLLDITFSLIMFFMLTTTFLQTQSMSITLPRAASSEQSTVSREMLININSQGVITVDGQILSLETLGTKISTWREKTTSQPTIVIWGDKDSKHGTIVEIMDLAKNNGIEEIVIATVNTKKQ